MNPPHNRRDRSEQLDDNLESLSQFWATELRYKDRCTESKRNRDTHR